MATVKTAATMVMKVLVLGLVLLAYAGLIAHAQPQCGSQGGGATCSNNLCCSQWGYCGLGGDYCGNGCQSGPCYTTYDKWKKLYATEAQVESSREELAHTMATVKTAATMVMKVLVLGLVLLAYAGLIAHAQPQCGSQGGGATCSNNLCCSQWGYCGLGGDYCGNGCQSGPCYTT
ncbi:uncharacterized protein [Setaria viridis]|uniref:uncharacterized protein n=1 Tax=Setaria viridis TaxID=4556 RepID=UPI003B3AAB83